MAVKPSRSSKTASDEPVTTLGTWTVENGAPVQVVKNGGLFDQLGTVSGLIGDDENGGTWVRVVINPDLPERAVIEVLLLADEQAARTQCAVNRARYYGWNIQDGNGPN